MICTCPDEHDCHTHKKAPCTATADSVMYDVEKETVIEVCTACKNELFAFGSDTFREPKLSEIIDSVTTAPDSRDEQIEDLQRQVAALNSELAAFRRNDGTPPPK